MFIQAMVEGPSVFHRGRSTPEWVARDGSWRAIVLGIAGFLAGLLAPASGLGQTVVVEGIVTDTTQMAQAGAAEPQPLAGARVWARGVSGQAEVDAAGRFRLELPGPDTYELTFHHPRLHAIGIEEVGWTEVEVPAEGVRDVHFSVPSWATLFARWCGRDSERVGPEGILAGWVRSGLDGAPLAEIEALLRPSRGGDGRLSFRGRTSHDGLFLFCAVPPGVSYEVTVDGFGLEDARESVRLDEGEVRELAFEFDVGGEGTLRGLVQEGEDGAPVGQAAIELRGPVARTTMTDGGGTFRMEGLPAGRYTIRVSHLAFQEVRREVMIPRRDLTVSVDVRLLAEAVALEPIVVEVEGRPPRPTWGPLVDVYERMDWMRKLGLGRICDRQDIEDSRAIRVSHLVSRIVGVRTRAMVGSPDLIVYLNHNRCYPSIYVDGVRTRGMMMDEIVIGNVEVIEVYRRLSQLPGEFYDQTSARCGAVAIWSRRGH